MFIIIPGPTSQPNSETTYTTNDIIGIAFDADTGTLTGYKNGTSQGTITTGLTSGPYFIVAASYDSASWTLNAGQRAFAYTPPTGFKALNTANLPNAPIKKPSDHFTTILDTGANILTAAKAKFPNGLWWIKDRANSNQHQLVDSVRGGNLAVHTPATGNESAYVAPSGNSVAWCWSLPDTFTPVASGGFTNLAGRRNVAAGFSAVTYTANATAQTLTHGLNAAPEFMMVRRRSYNSGTIDWAVHHKAVALNNYLVLNSSQGACVAWLGHVEQHSPNRYAHQSWCPYD